MDSARQISLVRKIHIDFQGDVVQGALCLEDVDGDGNVELVVGTMDGCLFVYRQDQVIASCGGLGEIVSVMVDDFLNQGEKVIVVITAEGKCFLFDLTLNNENENENDSGGRSQNTHCDHNNPIIFSTSNNNETEENILPENEPLTKKTNDADLLSSSPPRSSSNGTGTAPEHDISKSPNRTMQTKSASAPSSPAPPPSPLEVSGSGSPPGRIINDEIPQNENKSNITRQVKPIRSYSIPWNVTCALLMDLTGDGHSDLVIASHDGGAYSDTVVTALSIHGIESQKMEIISKWNVPGAAVSLSMTFIGVYAVILVGLHFGGFATIELDGKVSNYNLSKNLGTRMRSKDCSDIDQMGLDLGKREQSKGLAQLFDGSAISEDEMLSVDRPTFVLGNVLSEPTMGETNNQNNSNNNTSILTVPSTIKNDATSSSSSSSSSSSPSPQPSASSRKEESVENMTTDEKSFSTNIKSDVIEERDTDVEAAGLIAVCFGGRLRLERLYFERNVGGVICNESVWQEVQARQLFALQVVDVNENGDNEIISCAWDGLTCIYDLSNNVVRFQFDGRVQGFLAGKYTFAKGMTGKCFVYVTLGEGIVIYTDVGKSIKGIPALTLMDVLRERGQLESIFNKLDTLCDPSKKEEILMQIRNLNPHIRGVAYCGKLINDVLYKQQGVKKKQNEG